MTDGVTFEDVEACFGSLGRALVYLESAANPFGFEDAGSRAEARWASLIALNLAVHAATVRDSGVPVFALTDLGFEVLEDLQTFFALKREKPELGAELVRLPVRGK